MLSLGAGPCFMISLFQCKSKLAAIRNPSTTMCNLVLEGCASLAECLYSGIVLPLWVPWREGLHSCAMYSLCWSYVIYGGTHRLNKEPLGEPRFNDVKIHWDAYLSYLPLSTSRGLLSGNSIAALPEEPNAWYPMFTRISYSSMVCSHPTPPTE